MGAVSAKVGAWGQAARVVLSVELLEVVGQASAMEVEVPVVGAAAHQVVAKKARVGTTAAVAGRAMGAGIAEIEQAQKAAKRVAGWVEVWRVTAAEAMGVGLKAAEKAATVVADDWVLGGTVVMAAIAEVASMAEGVREAARAALKVEMATAEAEEDDLAERVTAADTVGAMAVPGEDVLAAGKGVVMAAAAEAVAMVGMRAVEVVVA